VVEAYLSSGSTTPLVVVGGRGWLQEGETALLDQVRRHGGPGAERIRQYDFLPRSLLVSLIRGARATLFPSLYEGFGLPALESMQLGTPVLASTTGALPEVTADAALLVDPYDVQALARGVRALDADTDLREALTARGRIQAARFTPQAYHDRLAALYGRLGLL
jgi:glycosyltransferase involved in cell wall biosynthesis